MNAVRATGRCLTVGELREALAGLADNDRVLVDGYDVVEVLPAADGNVPAGVDLRSGGDVCARHAELADEDTCECGPGLDYDDDSAMALLQRYADKELNANQLRREAEALLLEGRG